MKIDVPCTAGNVLEKKDGNKKIRVRVNSIYVTDFVDEHLQSCANVFPDDAFVFGMCCPEEYDCGKCKRACKHSEPVCRKCKYNIGERCTLAKTVPDEINFSDIGRGKTWRVVKGED